MAPQPTGQVTTEGSQVSPLADSGSTFTAEPTRPPTRAPFSIGATLAWGVIAFIPYAIIAVVYDRLLFDRFSDNWLLWAAQHLVGNVAAISIIGYAISRRGLPVGDYVGLAGFKARYIGIGIISQLGLMFLGIFLLSLIGYRIPRFGVVNGAALTEIVLWTYVLVRVVVTPICEEFVFRGFMYRSWARHMHPLLAVILTAFVFAVLHFDSLILWHGACGILYGCLRWRLGSIWAPISAHATANLVTVITRSIVELS